MLTVLVISHQQVLFEGSAQRVIVPGEQGVFEVTDHHRPTISRLLPGTVVVDGTCLPIYRGVVQVVQNRVTAIVESST